MRSRSLSMPAAIRLPTSCTPVRLHHVRSRSRTARCTGRGRHASPRRADAKVNVMETVFRLPVVTRGRIRAAYAVGAAIDALQLVAGPLGWVVLDEVLDVAAAILMWRLLGFHPLLLPTFVVEFLPLVDLLPTWTGCVAVVVALRKRQQAIATPPPASGPIIDV